MSSLGWSFSILYKWSEQKGRNKGEEVVAATRICWVICFYLIWNSIPWVNISHHEKKKQTHHWRWEARDSIHRFTWTFTPKVEVTLSDCLFVSSFHVKSDLAMWVVLTSLHPKKNCGCALPSQLESNQAVPSTRLTARFQGSLWVWCEVLRGFGCVCFPLFLTPNIPKSSSDSEWSILFRSCS